MRAFFLAAFAAIFITIGAGVAFAADVGPTFITVPWGDLIIGILPAVQALFLGGVLWLAATFSPPLYAFLRTKQVEQLLNRAGDFAFGVVPGAVKGREVSIDVGNEVLREMLSYALEHGGQWLTDFAGTPTQIAEKAFARIPWPAEMTKPDFAAIADEAVAQTGK